jgi:hypothetical protein
MSLQKVIACQDDSCHWYVIPAGMLDEFLKLCEEENDPLFDKTFGQYRTGGDLNNVQLWAEIK